MFTSYQFHLKPTTEQDILLRKHAGACRWLWNHMLALNIESHKTTGKFIFRFDMNNLLPALKLEYPWLNEINSQSLQHVCEKLSNALTRYFKYKSRVAKVGFQKAGRKVGFPKFKRRESNRCSFNIPQTIEIKDGKLKIPKFKYDSGIKLTQHREIHGKLKTATIIWDVNQWIVNIQSDIGDVPLTNIISSAVGIDLGIKSMAVLSDSTTSEYKPDQKIYSKIAQLQKLSRNKVKGSNRYIKRYKRIAKLHKKLRNQRKDSHHKTTNEITNNHDLIVLEDLNIQGMMKNHKLSKAIGQMGWHIFASMLKQKCERKGKHFIQVARNFASTKTCSSCGHKQDMPLNLRTYECGNCGFSLDRDLNASINLKQEGIRLIEDKIRQGLPEYKHVEILLDDKCSFEHLSQMSMKREATSSLYS